MLVILLSIGLVSGIGVKYLKGGFEKNEVNSDLVGVDESIKDVYEELNNPVIEKLETEKININLSGKKDLMKL